MLLGKEMKVNRTSLQTLLEVTMGSIKEEIPIQIFFTVCEPDLLKDTSPIAREIAS